MVSWPWSKPSEQELLKACKKAETEALIAQKDADTLKQIVPDLEKKLSERFEKDQAQGIPVTPEALAFKSTVSNKADAYSNAVQSGTKAQEQAKKALEGEESNSRRYSNATPQFTQAAGHFKTATIRGQEAKSAYDAALKAQEMSRRNWEKSLGIKQYATACIAPVAEIAAQLNNNEFVDAAQHAAFLTEQEAGLKAYNKGKGGFYEAAAKHLNEAAAIGTAALKMAAQRRDAYTAGMDKLKRYKADIAAISSAITAPETSPEKIYLFIKATGGSYTDPSRFTDLVYRYQIKLKKGRLQGSLEQ